MDPHQRTPQKTPERKPKGERDPPKLQHKLLKLQDIAFNCNVTLWESEEDRLNGLR